jgi:hypothetical protein
MQDSTVIILWGGCYKWILSPLNNALHITCAIESRALLCCRQTYSYSLSVDKAHFVLLVF